jgi:hypothetical protein
MCVHSYKIETKNNHLYLSIKWHLNVERVHIMSMQFGLTVFQKSNHKCPTNNHAKFSGLQA